MLWEKVYQHLPFSCFHDLTTPKDTVRLRYDISINALLLSFYRLDTEFLQYFDWLDNEKENPYKLKCIQKCATSYIREKWVPMFEILFSIPASRSFVHRQLGMKAVFVGDHNVGKVFSLAIQSLIEHNNRFRIIGDLNVIIE